MDLAKLKDWISAHVVKIGVGAATGVTALVLAQCDTQSVRQNTRSFNLGVETAESEERERIMRNAQRAQAAAAGSSLDANRRVRGAFNRCDPDNAARDDNDC